MVSTQLVDDTRAKMSKSVEFLVESLRGLRSGRPSPALVENIRVDAYGSPMPLKQLASISVPEPRQLVLKPFDPSMVAAIEKAILKSDIGITPETDGKVVRLNVPMMSQEQRDKLVGRVKDEAEKTRITIRNIRRDQNKLAEAAYKAGEIGEDDEVKTKDAIQKLTKEMEAKIDAIVVAKSKEMQES